MMVSRYSSLSLPPLPSLNQSPYLTRLSGAPELRPGLLKRSFCWSMLHYAVTWHQHQHASGHFNMFVFIQRGAQTHRASPLSPRPGSPQARAAREGSRRWHRGHVILRDARRLGYTWFLGRPEIKQGNVSSTINRGFLPEKKFDCRMSIYHAELILWSFLAINIQAILALSYSHLSHHGGHHASNRCIIKCEK